MFSLRLCVLSVIIFLASSLWASDDGNGTLQCFECETDEYDSYLDLKLDSCYRLDKTKVQLKTCQPHHYMCINLKYRKSKNDTASRFVSISIR